jgi:hypothetical protein
MQARYLAYMEGREVHDVLGELIHGETNES